MPPSIPDTPAPPPSRPTAVPDPVRDTAPDPAPPPADAAIADTTATDAPPVPTPERAKDDAAPKPASAKVTSLRGRDGAKGPRRGRRELLDDDEEDPIAPAGPARAPGTGFLAGPVSVPTASERRLFSRVTILSFVLCVLLPVLASAVYYTALAVDRYAVEIKFAIRSPSGATSGDLLGIVTGGGNANSTMADSWMVVEYLESREFLETLMQRIDLAAVYGAPQGDILTRLPTDATLEDMVDYLPGVVAARFESSTQIITVETQAFTPEDATRMAEVVLDAASTLVNAVSEKARQDTVRLAEQEVVRAEQALRDQRTAIAAFRETEQKIDPTASVATQEGVLAQLQNRLASTRTELSSLREFLAPEAPSVRVLQSQIDSLERQIGSERARLGIGDGDAAAGTVSPVTESLNRSVTQYEALKVDLDFRERAYLSALSSLEAARMEADRQQRYVATFVTPAPPQSARYPQVAMSMAVIATVAFLIWGVLAMFLHILREHLT